MIVAQSVSVCTVPFIEAIAGVVRVLLVSVLVLLIVGTVTHSTAITPADTREIVVSVAAPSSIVVTCGLAEYAGATHTPPDTRTLHTATSATRFRAVVLEAVMMSPIACDARVILAQSFLATVKFASGNVIVLAAVGQENVSN